MRPLHSPVSLSTEVGPRAYYCCFGVLAALLIRTNATVNSKQQSPSSVWPRTTTVAALHAGVGAGGILLDNGHGQGSTLVRKVGASLHGSGHRPFFTGLLHVKPGKLSVLTHRPIGPQTPAVGGGVASFGSSFGDGFTAGNGIGFGGGHTGSYGNGFEGGYGQSRPPNGGVVGGPGTSFFGWQNDNWGGNQAGGTGSTSGSQFNEGIFAAGSFGAGSGAFGSIVGGSDYFGGSSGGSGNSIVGGGSLFQPRPHRVAAFHRYGGLGAAGGTAPTGFGSSRLKSGRIGGEMRATGTQVFAA